MTAPVDLTTPATPRIAPRWGALLAGTGILASRVAGFVRERVFAHYFGNSDALDVWRAAQKVPNLVQNLLGEGVLSASFIPVYAQLLSRKEDEEADRVAGAVFGLLALVLSIVVIVGMAAAPWLVAIFQAGFPAVKQAETVALVRIFYPATGLLVLSAWCLGILNSHRRFFLSYAAPVVWNLAIIAVLVVFGSRAGGYRLAAVVAWGALAGSLLQFAVQLPAVFARLRSFRPSLGTGSPHVAEIRRTFLPVVFGRGALQVSGYVDQFLASFLPGNAISALGYAQTLHTLPVSLFGMSIAASELPEMARDAGDAEGAPALLRARLDSSLRRVAFLIVPSVAAFLLLGDSITALLFQTGRFGPDDVRRVWAIVGASSVGLLAATSGRLYASTFYALRDTRTPFRIALTRVAVAGALGWLFAFHGPSWLGVDPRHGAAGLALAGSAAAWLEWGLLRRAVVARIGGAGLPAGLAARLVTAALAGSAAGMAVKHLTAGLTPIAGAPPVLIAFGIAYLASAKGLGVPEVAAIASAIRSRLPRR